MKKESPDDSQRSWVYSSSKDDPTNSEETGSSSNQALQEAKDGPPAVFPDIHNAVNSFAKLHILRITKSPRFSRINIELINQILPPGKRYTTRIPRQAFDFMCWLDIELQMRKIYAGATTSGHATSMTPPQTNGQVNMTSTALVLRKTSDGIDSPLSNVSNTNSDRAKSESSNVTSQTSGGDVSWPAVDRKLPDLFVSLTPLEQNKLPAATGKKGTFIYDLILFFESLMHTYSAVNRVVSVVSSLVQINWFHCNLKLR